MKTYRPALVLFGGLTILGFLSRDEMRPTSTAQVLVAITAFTVSFGSAVAASIWLWRPLIARFGYYRACAIFCGCLFCVLAPTIAVGLALCSFAPFYRDISYSSGALACIGSWFISTDHKEASNKSNSQ